MEKPLIVVKNAATLAGLDSEAIKAVKNHLTISNPLFEKKNRIRTY
mgnify:CR=1 FL=1